MNEGTYYYVIAVFLVYFVLSNLVVPAYYRFKDRNRYYFSRLRQSKWEIRIISSILSMGLTVLTTILYLKSEIEFELIKNMDIEFGGVYVAIGAIFALSLAYIIGSKKGEEFSKGLTPIVRKPASYSIINEPYTTLSQSYVFPPAGRRIPSRREMMDWRERTRDFASSGAQWAVLYLLYLLLYLEFFIVFAVAVVVKGVRLVPSWEVIKAICLMLTLGFIPYMFCTIIVHKPIIWLLESIKDRFLPQKSSKVEWGLFIVHSLLFYLVSIVAVLLIIRFGN